MDSGNGEIRRFVVSHKKAFGGPWEERSAGKHATSFAVGQLECGTAYRLFAAAVNDVGAGRPSAVITASTQGPGPSETLPYRQTP